MILQFRNFTIYNTELEEERTTIHSMLENLLEAL